MIRVIKRDGRIVDYNESKVNNAIWKAMERTQTGIDTSLSNKIVESLKEKFSGDVNVESVQDFIEKELMKSKRKDVAKEFIKYRHQRNIAREAETINIFMGIINAENNEVTRENANMNSDSPAGMMMKFASETTKPFVDNYLLSEDTREAIKSNYLHIHDKDYYPSKSLTCLQHPLDRILQNGFMAGHGEARAAKRIETASILACISMESIQNEMHK